MSLLYWKKEGKLGRTRVVIVLEKEGQLGRTRIIIAVAQPAHVSVAV